MNHMIKLLNNVTAKQHRLPLIVLSVISVFIWYGGPLIAVADSVPLAEPEKRFYTILALILAWILKINFIDNKQKPDTTTPLSFLNPELAKKIQSIDSRFQGAMKFLKKTLINKNGKDISLYHLPWYLLVGPANSGKTTLLANANINYILAKQFKNENLRTIPASDACDWWVTRDLVMLDVPSNYLYGRPKNSAGMTNNTPAKSSSYSLWQSFLGLVKKYRGKNAVSGVVLTLSLSEIMNQQNDRPFAELKQRINELREQFGNQVPFFLTITKCDLLPGFIDFFSDSGSDELSQAWGVSLPGLKENETLSEVFTHRFNALIKRLNKQLIWRLHQERNAFTRPQIKDFPLQLERLKENILNVFKSLTSTDNSFHLQGVYLTSSVQQVNEELNNTHIPASSANAQSLQIMRNPVMPSRAYFVRQLLLQGVLATGEHVAPVSRAPFNFYQRPVVYGAAFTTIALAVACLTVEFGHSMSQTYAIKDGLTQYQVDVQQASQQAPHLAKALTLLNALQQTAAGHTILPYADKAQQSASAAYQQALKTIVLPEIKTDLETYLASASNKNPEGLYVALKAYLMLGEGQHLQPDYVFNALEQITSSLFNKQNSSELSNHIHAALNTAWQPMELDQELVTRARRMLTNLAPVELSYAIVKSMPANSMANTISIEVNPDSQSVLINKEISFQIPKMFTADNFQEIYDHQTVAAAKEVTDGSWIIAGYNSAPSTEVLTEQLRNLYLSNYVTTWENVISNVRLLVPTSLAEADKQLVSLAHDNSPLLQLLASVHENTSFTPVINASPKLAAINAFLSTNGSQENSPLYKTFIALNQAHAALQNILISQDVDANAFKTASAHMKNPANAQDVVTLLFNTAAATPAPLKTWVEGIAVKSWHFMLADAAQHIEKHWKSDIMTVYNAQMVNRFPFNPTANKDISLEQFTKFLGTRGAVTSFYQNYMQAFIETSSKGWAWKQVNNDQIPFTTMALNGMQHAAILQHTFFPNEDNQVSVKFTLQPVALDSSVKNFELKLNGQSIQYDHATAAVPQPLIWPGNKNQHSTTLNLLAVDNKKANNFLNDEWGFFRLVNKSTQKIVSPTQLQLTFDVNGHKTKYLLFMTGHVNPFILANLQNLRLPQELINA